MIDFSINDEKLTGLLKEVRIESDIRYMKMIKE